MADHFRTDLDQFVLQARQRPVLDRLRRRPHAQEIAEVVGERTKLEPHRVGGERLARQSRPLDRAFALLNHNYDRGLSQRSGYQWDPWGHWGSAVNRRQWSRLPRSRRDSHFCQILATW